MSGESCRSLLLRIIYTIQMAFRFRTALSLIQRESTLESPWEISFEKLQSTGAKVIVLDFDGVLAPYGEERPGSLVLDWLEGCGRQFGRENVFILSNNPSTARIEFIQERFPGIRWISDSQPKPYPEGLERIISLVGLAPCEVLMVDDRLLTGGLCACITQVNFYYVRCPIVDLTKCTSKELFFMTLRGMERLLLRFF